jgi:hypothetical protein
LPIDLGQSDHLDSRRRRTARTLLGNQQTAHAIVGKHPGICAKPPIRINNDSRWLRSRDPPYRQLGIIGDGCADADDDDVHQGPQPMQMHQSSRPVNVFRMAGFGSNPAVKRLSELADDQTIVHRSLPQRAKHIRPALRERLALSAEYVAEVFPWIGRRRLAQWEIGYWHAEIKNPVW